MTETIQIGKTISVKELIEKLQQYPEDMLVCDADYDGITEVTPIIWMHTNYPFDKPEREFLKIC